MSDPFTTAAAQASIQAGSAYYGQVSAVANQVQGITNALQGQDSVAAVAAAGWHLAQGIVPDKVVKIVQGYESAITQGAQYGALLGPGGAAFGAAFGALMATFQAAVDTFGASGFTQEAPSTLTDANEFPLPGGVLTIQLTQRTLEPVLLSQLDALGVLADDRLHWNDTPGAFANGQASWPGDMMVYAGTLGGDLLEANDRWNRYYAFFPVDHPELLAAADLDQAAPQSIGTAGSGDGAAVAANLVDSAGNRWQLHDWLQWLLAYRRHVERSDLYYKSRTATNVLDWVIQHVRAQVPLSQGGTQVSPIHLITGGFNPGFLKDVTQQPSTTSPSPVKKVAAVLGGAFLLGLAAKKGILGARAKSLLTRR